MDYEGSAAFTYADGDQQTTEIVWSSAFSHPPSFGADNSAFRVKRAATFSAAAYLKRPGELVTITFDDQSHYGYYDNPKPGSGSVTYTFHSQ